ncbi:DUF3999 family protein [Flammeovirga pacifica]|uniref:DUF3999 domain-containing protein n=1 Tax=Flammeovirga pacifica TaxID=915059 RepID=A0A1S1YTW6_FLAPC|nr:DUF3999 family protein [Flammeovirga pacifica]OHX64458.1 hypothetical protein NH26_23010 [Flammeovirga pacifica]
MKTLHKTIAILLYIISFFGYSQTVDQFDYKSDLNGIQDQWHTIELTDHIIGQCNQRLSDIRVFGITASNDTIIAPYILDFQPKKVTTKEVEFKQINSVQNSKGYYYTFALSNQEAINQIQLVFGIDNFDWKVALEGSQNQKEWYTIVKDYRLLSIKNDHMDYQFTDLNFPSSNYPYFRLKIESKEKPQLTSAKITQKIVDEGNIKNYTPQHFQVNEIKKQNTSEIEVDFGKKVRINHLKFTFNNTFDFYRNASIKYLADSVKTEKGWKYSYVRLKNYTFNSVDKNEVNFKSTTIQKLKIEIYNRQNQPLTIGSIQAEGNRYSLLTRFTEEAKYFIAYDGLKVYAVDYDIKHFRKNIPENLSKLTLSTPIKIKKVEKEKEAPLFENEMWLWAIMLIMVVVLGGFAVKMMKAE